ncbi:hypothetical protein niasHT_005506 [Heterodera trifolii]|uniref:Uncharacterized protein n=1 Tax=Heterodera trifolii TaxID=157864 RepID=A0ABD2LT72_9BILA
MSDRRKEAEAKMAKAIFISADCWLSVFDLLPAYQLGLRIALISHRFDYYVDEHFKTRKWAFRIIRIEGNFGKNGIRELEIANSNWKSLPIPQIQMPHKVVGFRRIIVRYLDQNVIAFLHHFRPIFASNCPINLAIDLHNDRITEFFLRNIWPMFEKNIHGLELSVGFFNNLRKFVPTILNDCPSLRFVSCCFGDLFPEFPCNDSAAASDGQALAKWLFTARPDNVPKVFKCDFVRDEWKSWLLKIAAVEAAFDSASSPANFIVVFWFNLSRAGSVQIFTSTKECTREQLVLKRADHSDHFLLVCSPIARDESKWTKWENEAIEWKIRDQWNQIHIQIFGEYEIGKGLLDSTPGPSDQQKK